MFRLESHPLYNSLDGTFLPRFYRKNIIIYSKINITAVNVFRLESHHLQAPHQHTKTKKKN